MSWHKLTMETAKFLPWGNGKVFPRLDSGKQQSLLPSLSANIESIGRKCPDSHGLFIAPLQRETPPSEISQPAFLTQKYTINLASLLSCAQLAGHPVQLYLTSKLSFLGPTTCQLESPVHPNTTFWCLCACHFLIPSPPWADQSLELFKETGCRGYGPKYSAGTPASLFYGGDAQVTGHIRHRRHKQPLERIWKSSFIEKKRSIKAGHRASIYWNSAERQNFLVKNGREV